MVWACGFGPAKALVRGASLPQPLAFPTWAVYGNYPYRGSWPVSTEVATACGACRGGSGMHGHNPRQIDWEVGEGGE